MRPETAKSVTQDPAAAAPEYKTAIGANVTLLSGCVIFAIHHPQSSSSIVSNVDLKETQRENSSHNGIKQQVIESPRGT